MSPQNTYPDAFTALDLWAASAYAYRVNKGYIKSWASGDTVTNMQLVKQQLKENLSSVSDRDRTVGKLALEHFKRDMLMRTLKGDIKSDFERKLSAATAMEEFAFHADKSYWSVVPSQIAQFVKQRAYQDAVENVDIQAHPVAEIKTRITADIKIIKDFYSQNWGTYYYTALTDSDQLVRFAYKEKLKLGRHYSVKGTVVDFADKTTKLNRVTIVK